MSEEEHLIKFARDALFGRKELREYGEITTTIMHLKEANHLYPLELKDKIEQLETERERLWKSLLEILKAEFFERILWKITV